MPYPFQFKFTVVDDDRHALYFVERTLREAFPGSEISIFNDGTEALNHVQERETDMLITDHSMQRMDGADLIRELRTNGFTLPIVMISSSPNAQELGTAAGATAFVEKSAVMADLADIVGNLLKESKSIGGHKSNDKVVS